MSLRQSILIFVICCRFMTLELCCHSFPRTSLIQPRNLQYHIRDFLLYNLEYGCEGNCSVLRGLPSDAQHLSRVTEFAPNNCNGPFACIFFLRQMICAILSILRLNIYKFVKEMHGSTPTYNVAVETVAEIDPFL